MKQRGWFGWVLIIGLVLGLGCSGDKKGSQSSTAFPDSLVAEDLLATVNDYPIRGQDLRIFANLNGDGGDRNQTAAQYNENLLEQYIRRILLWKEAVAFGVAADDSTANSLYLRLAQSVGGERALADQLSRVKIKPEEVIQSIKRDLVIKSFVMDHFSSQISVDETEAEEFYRIASPRFRTPDRIKARHILLQVRPDDTEETRLEKKAKLQKILAEAKAGGDFAALASQYSEGPSRDRGGDLGYFERGTMVQPFDSVAFSLELGEISGIVETQFGYHIIKLEDKKEGVQQTYEAVKDSLIQAIRQRKLGVTVLKHLQEMYDLAIIKRYY